jgi:hypothetical protein
MRQVPFVRKSPQNSRDKATKEAHPFGVGDIVDNLETKLAAGPGDNKNNRSFAGVSAFVLLRGCRI